MSTDKGLFSLINLTDTGNNIGLDFFPREVTTDQRANYEPVDTKGGTQPLEWVNRSGRRLRVDEMWLDKTDSGESIEPQIEALYSMMENTTQGMPPVLLAVWGDRWERGVMEELSITEVFFNEEGFPLRARCSFSMIEMQDMEESVTVTIHEDDAGD